MIIPQPFGKQLAIQSMSLKFYILNKKPIEDGRRLIIFIVIVDVDLFLLQKFKLTISNMATSDLFSEIATVYVYEGEK